MELEASVYVPYTGEYEADSGSWCFTGVDASGNFVGVGAGVSIDEARKALHDYVVEVLLSDAGGVVLALLCSTPPEGGEYVTITADCLST